MLLKRQIEDLEKGLKISMLSRVFTALSLISVILVVLYLQNIWLFTSLIFLVCIIAFYEWIKNKFNKIVFGFILIFNFGFWSIFFILLGESYGYFNKTTLYLLYGLIILNTGLFDTFAFIVGSKFGKTFIVKKISPNKTISGAFGSILFTVVGTTLFILYLQKINNQLIFFKSSLLLYIWLILMSIYCQGGDLFVSYLKRKAKVKDTGNFLPGHGGILDRLDGMLLAIPIGVMIWEFLIRLV